jgi:flagellar hook-associated protein 2
VLTSSTNTLTGVLEDVTINLTGTSNDPVDVSIVQDVDQIVEDLSNFVSSYNGVLEAIEDDTSFNPETNERGPLFGDGTVNLVQNRLRTVVNARVAGGAEGLDRLILVGIRVGGGGRLAFDEERFRAAYTDNPEAIESLFATEETGVGDRLDETLDDLTRSFDGVLTRRDRLLQDREELFNDRIAALEEQLARKRERLQRQFAGLETSLSNLQGAQTAISQLAALAAG